MILTNFPPLPVRILSQLPARLPHRRVSGNAATECGRRTKLHNRSAACVRGSVGRGFQNCHQSDDQTVPSLSDGNRTGRRLYAHGLHSVRLWVRVVLGLPDPMDPGLHGSALVRLKEGCDGQFVAINLCVGIFIGFGCHTFLPRSKD